MLIPGQAMDNRHARDGHLAPSLPAATMKAIVFDDYGAADVLPFAGGKNYFAVKNFINETSFFEWDPAVYDSYFKMAKGAVEINIPKLNEMAYEQVDLAGIPFSTFIKNKNAQGHNANYSLVLRGYVKTWLKHVFDEYERVGLIDRLTDE